MVARRSEEVGREMVPDPFCCLIRKCCPLKRSRCVVLIGWGRYCWHGTMSKGPFKIIISLVACASAVWLVPACSSQGPDLRSGRTASGKDTFALAVKPLLEHRCVWCHNDEVAQGGLNFQDRASVFDSTRAFIVPGEPDKSEVYLAVTRGFKHPRVMPGDGWGISDHHRQALKQWIAEGASWPEGRRGTIKRKSYEVELDDL